MGLLPITAGHQPNQGGTLPFNAPHGDAPDDCRFQKTCRVGVPRFKNLWREGREIFVINVWNRDAKSPLKPGSEQKPELQLKKILKKEKKSRHLKLLVWHPDFIASGVIEPSDATVQNNAMRWTTLYYLLCIIYCVIVLDSFWFLSGLLYFN